MILLWSFKAMIVISLWKVVKYCWINRHTAFGFDEESDFYD